MTSLSGYPLSSERISRHLRPRSFTSPAGKTRSAPDSIAADNKAPVAARIPACLPHALPGGFGVVHHRNHKDSRSTPQSAQNVLSMVIRQAHYRYRPAGLDGHAELLDLGIGRAAVFHVQPDAIEADLTGHLRDLQ